MENIRIGFTGTRQGMSIDQETDFILYLFSLSFEYRITEFHHGDCIGADAQAHDIIASNFHETKIIIHPPIKTSWRAYKKGDFIYHPEDYLGRNREIVKSCDILLAAPFSKSDRRGGTWYTIRYAELKRAKVVVFNNNS
jgi:hypothetical protein